MPKYPIRLIEQYSTSGHADFVVDAPTPEHAADIVFNAHEQMRAKGASVVNLPDGQSQMIECMAEEGPVVRVVLLDGDRGRHRELRSTGTASARLDDERRRQ